jgi:steroid delta-isomerase-like uncharacterized protein
MLIARYFQAFNQRDHQALLALLSDDVIHDVNQGQRELGRQSFAAFLAHMDRCYSEQILDLVILRDTTGTRFAAEFTVVGTYRVTDAGFPAATGQTYRLRAGTFFEVELAKIVRVSTYYNVREWLLQIGGANP